MDAELLRGLAGLREAIKDWGDNMRSETMADLLAHVDRIELSVAQGQGWRPIESAPRDGTKILLASFGGVAWLGYWRVRAEGPSFNEGWTRFNCCDTNWTPNVWMPAPAAPAQPDGVGK